MRRRPHPHRILEQTTHRPWPLPKGPWVMTQTWENLLFAHWPVTADELRRMVPAELPVDTFDGTGWIGVVPFVLRNLRLRLTPPVPGLSEFPELNVRTYVTVGGRPGVYFFSLDAASWPAVFGARRTYGLPYFRADMSAEIDGDGVVYSSERRATPGDSAGLRARYGPRGPSFSPEPGSLEHFLAERYCLYAVDGHRRVRRADVHHVPWPLRAAEATFERNTMTRPFGVELFGEPLLHFAARQDVLVWPPRRVSGSGQAVEG